MMQVSTMYAQSLERQLVSRRSQLIHNLSRSSCGQSDPMRQAADAPTLDPLPPLPPPAAKGETEVDPKECTDRLCRLPSQCRGGHILGSPRRQTSAAAAASRLTQSTGNLTVHSDLSLMKKKDADLAAAGSPHHSPVLDKKAAKKAKEKQEKEAKRSPSNFMLLTPWFTRQNCEKLLTQVRSGDILEFNIKLHHHWGIAVLPKNKSKALSPLPPSLSVYLPSYLHFCPAVSIPILLPLSFSTPMLSYSFCLSVSSSLYYVDELYFMNIDST